MTASLEVLLLIAAGTVAGFLNVTAGGGSLLTLPVLIFLGLPAATANGTNRIAILVQNAFATLRFHRFKVIPKGLTIIAVVPAIVGAIFGALLAVDIDDVLFRRILAIVMILLTPFMFFRGNRREAPSPKIKGARKVWLVLAFLGVGFYGGFIQGGIGFLFILVLSILGLDLVRTNALKVLIILIFSPFALAVFMWTEQVDYVRGLTLALGNAGGAWLGSKVVVEKGERFLRWLVLVMVLAFAIRLFLT